MVSITLTIVNHYILTVELILIGVQNLPKIDTFTMFIGNQALRGGAVYVGDIPILIANSTFKMNNASDGGAVASFGGSKQL